MPNTDYETELTGSRDEIAAALEGVVDGLLAGSIRLDDGEQAVTVDPPEDLSLDIEFEIEDDEASLELELEWPAVDGTASVEPAEAASGGTADTDRSDADAAEETAVDAGDASEPEETAAVDIDDSAVDVPVRAGDASQSLARFEVFRDKADEWRWRLRHRNGNVIATSGEGYTRKHNARKGLRSVVANAPGAAVTDEHSDE